ncbi:MAG: hypothetical protein EBS06_02410 [Proteobacteria bacterium]|nr:hypothetical protein [Pseudomonadota bacterium]
MPITSPSESAQRISSQSYYQNDEIDLLTELSLPANAALIKTELSHKTHQEGLVDILKDFKTSTEVEQLVMPINISNNHFAGLHLEKDQTGKIRVSYFDPMGTTFVEEEKQSGIFGAITRTFFGSKKEGDVDGLPALKNNSLPDHIISALADALEIDQQDIIKRKQI